MAHNCVDWTTHPPARKTPLLVLTHGDDDVYTVVPDDLKTLEEIARREFSLGDGDVYFLSTCASLCHGKPARITGDAWVHISPYIGCATVHISRPRDPPQDDAFPRDKGSDAASGSERFFSAKRKVSENDQSTSDQGNDVRSSTTEDEEQALPRPRTRRRVVSEEDEQDRHESQVASQTQPPPPEIKQEKVGSQENPPAPQPVEPPREPDVPIKQEKRTGGNPTQSPHTESDTQTQADTDKLMIRVAHPPSNQEAKFMTKSSTSVGKVLAGACKSFSLDLKLATLYLLVKMDDEEGKMVDLKFPCDNADSISRAGAERGVESRFLLKMAGED